MTRLSIFFFIFSLALNCSATPETQQPYNNIGLNDQKPESQNIEIEKPDHLAFDQMLQAYVSNTGIVDYRNWKNDLTKLNEYLVELSQDEPNKNWSRSEKLAFWINLYNASTIKLILDNAPVKSIMDIDGGKPWDRKWIKVGSNVYSLNQVENDIIRPRFGDARIHFAVNCAAQSCPPLHNRAFTADNLNGTLASLTRRFINNSNFNVISENSLKLSNIFNWYASDFGDIKAYIKQYTDVEIKDKANIKHLEYDWSLNGK